MVKIFRYAVYVLKHKFEVPSGLCYISMSFTDDKNLNFQEWYHILLSLHSTKH